MQQKANVNTILEKWQAEAFAWPYGPLLYSFELDFDRHPGIDRASGQATLRMFSTQVGAIESFYLLDPSESFGVLKGTQQANDDDVLACFANSGFKLSDCHGNFEVRFAAKWKVSVVNNCDFHIGTGIYDESYAGSEPQDHVSFRLVESEGNGGLGFRFGKDGAYGGGSNALTLADATYVRTLYSYKPDIGGDRDNGTFAYWMDSNSSYQSETNLRSNGKFPDDVMLFPFWQHQNGGAIAMTHSLDWVKCWVVRPDYVKGTG